MAEMKGAFDRNKAWRGIGAWFTGDMPA